MPAAFVAQALGSLLAWLLVNDESPEGGAWSNTDFGQWLAVSLLCTTLVGGVSGVASRRWVVAVAVAAGCTLAVVCGCALFVGDAVLNSA